MSVVESGGEPWESTEQRRRANRAKTRIIKFPFGPDGEGNIEFKIDCPARAHNVTAPYLPRVFAVRVRDPAFRWYFFRNPNDFRDRLRLASCPIRAAPP